MTSPDRPLHIVHLGSYRQWTGPAEPVAALAAEQAAQGHQVEMACLAGSGFERHVERLGLPLREGFFFDRHLNLGRLRHDVHLLRRWVQTDSLDVIHCHEVYDHWVAALALRQPFRRKPGRPVIIRTVHQEGPLRRDLAHRWLVGKGADEVLAVSQSQRRRLIEEVGLPPSRVVWVRGAVDLERFHPEVNALPLRERCNISPKAQVAGLIARMRPGRGHEFFLDCLDDVVSAEPMAMLAVGGRGELKQHLIDRIKRHPLRANLCRIPYCREELPEVYAALNVAVMLSSGSDGSCRAMLEAMACGRPVIGCKTGAMTDAITPGENGWLIAKDNRAELTQALIEALSDPERTRRMGLAARLHVERYHSRSDQASAIEQVYRQALTRRTAS